MLGRLTTHAIRAFRDVQHLPGSAVNLTERDVGPWQQIIAAKPSKSGVTDDYGGSIQTKLFNLRAEHHEANGLALKSASGPRNR